MQNGSKLSKNKLKIKEELILKKISSNDKVVLLDNNGKRYSSMSFLIF